MQGTCVCDADWAGPRYPLGPAGQRVAGRGTGPGMSTVIAAHERARLATETMPRWDASGDAYSLESRARGPARTYARGPAQRRG